MRPFDVLGYIKSYMFANTWEKQVDLRTSLILIMICWGCVDFWRFPKQPRKAIVCIPLLFAFGVVVLS